MPTLAPETDARYWAKVDQGGGPDSCWSWLASRNDRGYGKFWNGERLVYAHRLAYELEYGPISEGLTIDHLCRTRHCVNPDHLEVVTLRENILRSDSVSARHARKTHCPQGHPYSPENTRWEGRSRHCRACRRDQRGGGA